MLLYGATRWLLLPPYTGMQSLEKLTSMQRWLLANYDEESGSVKTGFISEDRPLRPLQCVQHAGEVTYVPTGWLHAIINLQPSVGIAYEVGDDSLPPEAHDGMGMEKGGAGEEGGAGGGGGDGREYDW